MQSLSFPLGMHASAAVNGCIFLLSCSKESS
jgi:hypothetical protein